MSVLVLDQMYLATGNKMLCGTNDRMRNRGSESKFAQETL